MATKKRKLVSIVVTNTVTNECLTVAQKVALGDSFVIVAALQANVASAPLVYSAV